MLNAFFTGGVTMTMEEPTFAYRAGKARGTMPQKLASMRQFAKLAMQHTSRSKSAPLRFLNLTYKRYAR